jgi:tRNA G18 (ribose-2'-O)-methylase SpoU
VPLHTGPGLDTLKGAACPLVVLSQKGTDIQNFAFPESFYLVPGLEGPGLPESLAETAAVSIPMASRVESLNAAIAVGIAVYVWKNRSQKN